MIGASEAVGVVETAQADKRTVDYCRVGADNCSAEVGILLNSFLHLFYPNAYPNILLIL